MKGFNEKVDKCIHNKISVSEFLRKESIKKKVEEVKELNKKFSLKRLI
jgi:hypothetical protein